MKTTDIQEQVESGHAVTIWEERDGFETIELAVHHSGFLLSIQGNDLEDSQNKFGYVTTETWIDDTMLDKMKAAMRKHEHLID